LQGYDHHRSADRQRMRREEERILAGVAAEIDRLVRRIAEPANTRGS
jgi:ssRNA-specific RNase YbeY (16S rRNA maturation enzyme)